MLLALQSFFLWLALKLHPLKNIQAQNYIKIYRWSKIDYVKYFCKAFKNTYPIDK